MIVLLRSASLPRLLWRRALLPVDRGADAFFCAIHFACPIYTGMSSLVKERPANPVEFLAHYLLQNNPDRPTGQ